MANLTQLLELGASREIDDLREEGNRLRKVDIEKRGEWLVSLCALAMEQIATHPDPKATLLTEDPLPEDSLALLTRLRRNYKRG